MTARHDPRDPLTPEERELAALLGTSAAGPSAELDARILAAARAALTDAAPQPAPVATSVPAAAVGVGRRHHLRPRGLRWARVGGIAASMVLVLGLGWRLALEDPTQRQDASEAAAVEEMAQVTTAPMITPPPPPPPSAEMAMAPGQDVAADAAAAASAQTDAAPASPRARPSLKVLAPPPPVMAAEPSPEAFPMPAPAPAPVTAAPQTAGPPALDNIRSDRAIASERRAQSAPTAVADNAAAANDADSLDRIEVTGSRLRMVDIAINDDARLPVARWLDRIRARRDDGDLDGARRSLARFRARHPRISIPGDLRVLDTGSR